MDQPRILMCPPDFYGIEYEINPWMSRSRGSDPERAQKQWTKLYETLQGLGVRIELLQPQPGLPDLVFTANAGLIFGNQFYSSHFRHEVRARETPHFEAWFASHGFSVVKLLACPDAETNRFGCNAVVVGKTAVTNTGCDRLAADLRKWGYEPVSVELDEFLKGGGSAKCLTLRLDGEDAAEWS